MQNRQDPQLAFDHLAVTAPDLVTGLAHTRTALGLSLPAGGAHHAMGTHNHLMAFGEDSYVEVIAPDPAAPPPGRPRWFALDHPRPAHLATWIARTDDLEAALAEAPVDAGRPTEMSRGDLHWRIAIRDDGELPMDGAFPTLIEWPDMPHPAGGMADLHARLERLQIETPAARVLTPWLAAHLDDPRIMVQQAPIPRLTARIRTPGGTRLLR